MSEIISDYVGMIAGIIGSITGIAGAIMGYIAYHRSNLTKALDLRIELKKSLNEAFVIHEGALLLIEDADRSRKGLLSATGKFRSGEMDVWNKELAIDKKAMEDIVSKLPHPSEKYEALSMEELEEKIVELHKLTTKIKVYVDKYEKALAHDDETRRFLRDQAHARYPKST